MKPPRISVAFFQVLTAVGFLVCYQPAWSDRFVFSPMVNYSILLALGVAQWQPRPAGIEQMQGIQRPKNVTVVDLFVYMSFVAIVLADVKLRHESEFWILKDINFIVLPSSFALWVQWRYRLSPLSGTIVNYAFSLCWAFCFGCMDTDYRNRYYYISDWNKEQPQPLLKGVESVTQMMQVGILTAAWYFIIMTLAGAMVRYVQSRINPQPANGSSDSK